MIATAGGKNPCSGGRVGSQCLLVACLTSQQHVSVSQGRICSDNYKCCHTEIEVADQTFYLTKSQYTDTVRIVTKPLCVVKGSVRCLVLLVAIAMWFQTRGRFFESTFDISFFLEGTPHLVFVIEGNFKPLIRKCLVLPLIYQTSKTNNRQTSKQTKLQPTNQQSHQPNKLKQRQKKKKKKNPHTVLYLKITHHSLLFLPALVNKELQTVQAMI